MRIVNYWESRVSKAIFKYANINAYGKTPEADITLEVNGKKVCLRDVPASNELIKELTALFKRHLPKMEDI